MTEKGWLNKQFDNAKRDLEELPPWLQDKTKGTESKSDSGSETNKVVQLRDAKEKEQSEE